MFRKYDVDDHFFKRIDSEAKAYLLGFFVADGTYNLNDRCIDSYRFQIKQQDIDRCVVEWFQKFIVPTAPIKYKSPYTDKKGTHHKGSYTLRWSSKSMHEDLQTFSIFPRKTYDLEFKFPFHKIPYTFRWDFIRGFFDGDGQASYSDITHQFTLSMVGTSKDYLKQIGELFKQEFKVEYRIEPHKKTNMVMYTLRFSANYKRLKFIKKLYKKFYGGKKYFLPRKQTNILKYLLFKYRDNPEDCERLQDIVERRE